MILKRADDQFKKLGWFFQPSSIGEVTDLCEQKGEEGLSLELVDELLNILDKNGLLKVDPDASK